LNYLVGSPLAVLVDYLEVAQDLVKFDHLRHLEDLDHQLRYFGHHQKSVHRHQLHHNPLLQYLLKQMIPHQAHHLSSVQERLHFLKLKGFLQLMPYCHPYLVQSSSSSLDYPHPKVRALE